MSVGAYHFARPDNNTPDTEAEHFLRIARPIRGELLPVLDWEHEPPTAAWALRFLGAVEAAIGATPIFYTFPDFLRRTGSFEALRRFPLWFAAYGANDGEIHAVAPPQGFRLAVHQFTSRGRVAGIAGDVDLNLLKLDSLRSLVYEPRPTTWKGQLEFHAGGTLVSTGGLRQPGGPHHPRGEIVDHGRPCGGRQRAGRTSSASRRPRSRGAPEAAAALPPNTEGDGFAGRWSGSEDRESLEVEEYEVETVRP